MQIDNGMCKCGTFKAGALTKNKGVLRFWTGNDRWRLHKKTMVPRCFQWNMVAEEEEASGDAAENLGRFGCERNML